MKNERKDFRIHATGELKIIEYCNLKRCKYNIIA